MAEFSRQWCEINDPDMPYDFDILDVFEQLEPNSYVSYICEGYGFLAIGRDDKNNCLLAMPHNLEEELVQWKLFDDIVK